MDLLACQKSEIIPPASMRALAQEYRTLFNQQKLTRTSELRRPTRRPCRDGALSGQNVLAMKAAELQAQSQIDWAADYDIPSDPRQYDHASLVTHARSHHDWGADDAILSDARQNYYASHATHAQSQIDWAADDVIPPDPRQNYNASLATQSQSSQIDWAAVNDAIPSDPQQNYYATLTTALHRPWYKDAQTVLSTHEQGRTNHGFGTSQTVTDCNLVTVPDTQNDHSRRFCNPESSFDNQEQQSDKDWWTAGEQRPAYSYGDHTYYSHPQGDPHCEGLDHAVNEELEAFF